MCIYEHWPVRPVFCLLSSCRALRMGMPGFGEVVARAKFQTALSPLLLDTFPGGCQMRPNHIALVNNIFQDIPAVVR